MNSRQELLSHLKNLLGDVTNAVEIGVWRGEFSFQVISILKPANFYAVDPYEIFEGMVSAPGAEFRNQESLNTLYEQVNKKIVAKGHSVIRKKSLDAVNDFENESLDYVYIDGDHTYEGCLADIIAWWPKVKSGGILAGDDYDISKTGLGFDFGVIEAVSEFAEKNNLKKHIHKMRTTQWYYVKP